VGVGTLVLGIWALKIQDAQLKVQDAQLKVQDAQVKAQCENNYEMSRQNALEEVSQGILSKEAYLKQFPPKT